jgi:hypothetical protein
MVIVVTRRTAFVGFALLGFVVVLVAGMLTPSVSQAATTYTRVASCAGLDFYPTDSETKYANNGALRTRTDDGGTGGSGAFRCDPGLPNHAVVTKVEFTVSMEQVTQTQVFGVRNCELRRSSLAVATAGSNQTMGSVNFRGSPPGGPQRASSASISYATVNNAVYGYWFECLIDQDPLATDIGIFGADVYYTITAANG